MSSDSEVNKSSNSGNYATGDEQSNTEEKVKVGWVYTLNKDQLKQELLKRNLKVEKNWNFDELRKVLVRAVREGIKIDDKAASTLNADDPNQNQLIANEESSASEADTDSMAQSEGAKLEFCLGKDDWEIFEERLEILFTAKDVKDDKKAAIMLTRLDEKAFMLIRNLCVPDKPATKSYDQLKTLMQNHLAPKPSEVMERCKFNQAKQESHEKVTEFAARLKKLSLHCNFADLSTACRDQFVCGIRDQDTKVALFKIKNLTFDNALEEAQARESAMQNALTSQKTLENKSNTSSVFKFHASGRKVDQANQKQSENSNTQKTEYKCYRCGKGNHKPSECRFRNLSCNVCHKKGHIEAACRSKSSRPSTIKYVQNQNNEDEREIEERGTGSHGDTRSPKHVNEMTSSERNYYLGDFFNIQSDTVNTERKVNIKAEPMYVNIEINNKLVQMEIDTGSYYSVISENTKNDLFKNAQMNSTNDALRGYDGRLFKINGELSNLKVNFLGIEKKLNFFVMPGHGPPLIGRQWLKEFDCWPLDRLCEKLKNYRINKIDNTNVKNHITAKYASLFDESPGLYNKGKIKLFLKDNAQPVALKARHLPHALKPLVEEEINRLVSLGHLERIETSEWATPIVPIIKNNGKVRICGDFKLTINPHMVINKYPLPQINDIFAKLQGGEYFTQLDLSHAYMQFAVDESCREYLTIITHTGLLRYTKMGEGVASGPGAFQQKMDECLAGIPGAIAYLDNIYVSGRNTPEHIERLERVCAKLKECNLRLNKEKSEFMKEKLEVLGFVIDRNGLHKSKSKVKAMVEAPTPKNQKELESFLGLINFYSRFLKDRAQNLKPLYECAKNNKFEWTDNCQKAFEWVKQELISPRVLAHYDPSKQVVLACDASAYGLSAVLSHIYEDGSERPIAYASKKIPLKEMNRSVIDKEASAIVFGFTKFYDFIYGREIILRTDHKPLQYLFGPKNGIPLTAASRLQRWAYFLSGFNYKIQHIKSEQNGNCDALSRLPVEDSTDIFDNEFTPLYHIESGINIDWKIIRSETLKDEVLKKIVLYVKASWPEAVSDKEKIFASKKNELNLENDCLFRGYRIIVPSSLRAAVLNELHASHMGMVKIKQFARSYVWWPGIDNDIEQVVKDCTVCSEMQKNPSKSILTPWPWPEKAWTRIHIDFLGPFMGHMYMVVIDAHSKWPEVIDFKENTKTYRVVEVCKKLFARHGLPMHIVTDNGPQFTSAEFELFVKNLGITHTFSPPYHPATNGAAENFVGTFKDKVTKIITGGKSLDDAINLFLFDYRSFPHCTTGKSPAWLLYKRELRTRLDLLRPVQVKVVVEKSQQSQIGAYHGSRKVDFNQGEKVTISNYGVDNKKRTTGVINKKLSPSTFDVETSPGVHKKRHKNQLISAERPALRRSQRIAAQLKGGGVL